MLLPDSFVQSGSHQAHHSIRSCSPERIERIMGHHAVGTCQNPVPSAEEEEHNHPPRPSLQIPDGRSHEVAKWREVGRPELQVKEGSDPATFVELMKRGAQAETGRGPAKWMERSANLRKAFDLEISRFLGPTRSCCNQLWVCGIGWFVVGFPFPFVEDLSGAPTDPTCSPCFTEVAADQ